MSRPWLLSLLCLSVLSLSLVQLTRARGELEVNEARTRILFQKEPAEVFLAVENSSGQVLNARVEVALLDPVNHPTSQTTGVQSIRAGSQLLKLTLPVSISNFKAEDRRQLLWYRLRYRLSEEGSPGNTITEGILSLSEIAADLFEIRVATAEVVREGGRYHVRVQAIHPITRRPAADVRINGEITLEDDDDKSVTLHASKTTDAKGFTALDFVLPQRFPQYPHSGEIRVIGRKGAIVAEAEGDVQVDQFARILINSDKPLYQPGQVMHVRALVFTPSRRALANQNILIRILDPEETTVFRSVVKSSRFGIVNTDWLIPENTRLGDYQIRVGVDGEEEDGQVAYNVRVSRYDLPNFSVSVQPDREYYLPGQNAEVKVRADYLFGKPVARGHVRVVREIERQWNYREQKWDIEKGDEHEGETDPAGFFTAHLDLASDHRELSDYQTYKDITYAAYFTDPTTNRTEQRRFDVRVTKEAIHVYVVENSSSEYNRALPLKFYVSTFYADGSPARCKVNVTLASASAKDNANGKLLATLRTNRYGLAKVNAARLPREFENDRDIDLVVSAVDSRGQMGSKTEELSFDDDETVLVETDKSLYRPGEPIVAFIRSSSPRQTVVVDLARDSSVIQSERVQLHDGRGSVTFPYKPEFKDKLTIAAYGDFSESRRMIDTRAVLYPRNPDLKVNVRTSQASYRPGEEAHVNLRVRAPEGSSAESALGVVVLDKAVEERFRTDQEFGQRLSTFNDAMQRFLGLDQQIAGVTLRDLQRLDMAKSVSPDLDLLAEILLNQTRDYFPDLHSSEQYETNQLNVFSAAIREQLEPLKNALVTQYVRKGDYPKDDASLRRLLSEFKIGPDTLRDPWGTPYQAAFFIDSQSDVFTLSSAGADKRFETGDDFSVERFSWPYFRPLGETIDKAVRRYHETTDGFIRDFATLRNELAKDSLDLNSLRDRWGQPYHFDFEVRQTNYSIKITSAGPDKQFSSDERYSGDDFVIWTSPIDYFVERRPQIQAALTQYLKSNKQFPQTDPELREALRNSSGSFETLRDPWDHQYYPIFKIHSMYADRARIENRGNSGESTTQRIAITPVTQNAVFITLRSMGADGKAGTEDDFDVASFGEVISEQARGESQPQAAPARVVLSATNGAIVGRVTDANGAAIPQTTVTATRSPGGQSYYSSTDDNGKYNFGLPAGLYEVRFEARGFTVAVFTNVLVTAFNLTELNATLQAGSVAETVTVTGGSLQNNMTEMSVNASRSSVPGTVITKSQDISTPRLREYFPETLVWQPSIETDKQGRAKLSFKLADNITTWKMAVIGSTEDGWIGTAETEIKAFQPFFVEHDPPRVLTEGDEISLPVVVRNYLERPQNVDLEIKPESWFALLGPARKRIAVVAGDATRETFDLRAVAAVNDGKQRITATGGEVSDAIEKPVTVHPDGKEMSVTAGDILSASAALQLDLPETMIPNSGRAELKIYPNLMAHVIESVEAIMARPHGCGEQTISSTYPSLLLLRQHKQSGDDFPLRARAQRYLNDGYSRLLNYRDESGGFTYWGRGEPDVALTAYALRFLTDAADLIAVDQEVIKQAREWLIKQQRSDGSWPVHEYGSSGEDIRRSAVLTAYVTRILTLTDPRGEAVKRALDYLDKRAREIDEPYLLASYGLAAIQAQDITRAKFVIEKLRSLAHAEGSTSYWELDTNTPFYGWGVAGRVETTALVVQAMSRYCNSQTANCEPYMELSKRGLLFLLKQKDRYGVWYSTQATINVLDAMLTLFSSNSVNSTPSAAEIFVNGRLVQTLQMPAARGLVNPITVELSQHLRSGKNRIEIKRASGSPFASVNALVNYYVPWSSVETTQSNDLRLLAKFDKTEGGINDKITCHVEAERIGLRSYGMMLAEIGLPPGADVDRSSLEAAMKASGWAINQYDVLPDRVVLYLWPSAGGVKFDFQFRPRFGLNAQTAASVIYDYYNPESRATLPPARFRVK